MNIHLVQHNIVTNNPEENLKWILEELDTPTSKEALLTVFPACTLCGSPLYGSVAYTDIQKRAQAVLQDLIQRSEHRAFLIGMPLQIQDKGLCNAIVFVQNCAIRGIITKKYLAPDEQKYFVRGEGVQIIQYQEQSIAIGFYEDLKELAKSHTEQPDMVICCGCNVFDYNKPYRIRYRMHKIVENLNASLVFVNRIGGEGCFLYAGGSMAFNAAGNVLCQFPYFEAHSESVDMQLIEECADEKPEAVELVYKALLMGIREEPHPTSGTRPIRWHRFRLGMCLGLSSHWTREHTWHSHAVSIFHRPFCKRRCRPSRESWREIRHNSHKTPFRHPTGMHQTTLWRPTRRCHRGKHAGPYSWYHRNELCKQIRRDGAQHH